MARQRLLARESLPDRREHRHLPVGPLDPPLALVGEGEVVSQSPYPKIDLITQPPVDARWLEGELARLERLVGDGETLELVGALNRLVGASGRPAAAESERVG